MENLNQSLKEAVCIDEEVFFGPITDKEKKIRDQFEILHRTEFNVLDASKTVEDDESQNYSVYKSFSVDESKYDSFDDSLNEGIDKMPQEAKLITVRKSYDKIKCKRSGFYDSLEDVCSLVSNIDKCSISCEVENESNLNSKHFVEDSLKILPVPVASKNNFINDQVHFDDDSLAILECETTFSDSLEEVNVLESIEIEDINDIENISVENQNVLFTIDQHSTDPPKNLFDTSVEIVCEKKKDSEIADQDESFDDKNLLYDSLSNSDFKDILTDSLEEGKQLKEMLSLSKHTTINIAYNEENIILNQNKELLNVEQNCSNPLPNLFDTSIEILSEKQKNNNFASPKEFLHNKNVSCDSLSNSEIKDVSKDSLEESAKSTENLNLSQQSIGNNITKSEDIFPKQNQNKELLSVEQNCSHPLPNLFDTSIQILSEKQKNNNFASPKEFLHNKNVSCDSLSNSEIKDVSKDSLEESAKSTENLNLSQQSIGNNITKSEDVFPKQNQNKELLNVEQNCSHPLPNLFDTSVQIVSEKQKNNNFASPKEFLHNKNVSCDSLSNSKIKEVSKDSLEESAKSTENLNLFQQSIGNDILTKSGDVFPKQNPLETSVQIVYDNLSDCFEKETAHGKIYNSEQNFEKFKSFQENSKKHEIETGIVQSAVSKNTLLPDCNINEDKKLKSNISIISDPVIAISSNDISNSKKETFSVESCHLKVLNDDINIEKDLKFQLHIEVTVGDKKCQLASQDIKIVPVSSQDSESEKIFVSAVSVTNSPSHSISNTTAYIKRNEDELLLNNSKLTVKNEDCNVFRTHSPSEINSTSHKKSETMLASNVTQRKKSSASKTSCIKLSCMDTFNDVSLLQALDLPDHSASFLTESVIQSKDSLIPLNLYSYDDCIQNFRTSQFKSKNKENIPEHVQVLEAENFCTKKENFSPNKIYNSKTAQSFQKGSSCKETYKKTPGTKIPVRKVDNFAIPTPTPSKFIKPLPTTLSVEKVKKCQHSPHSIDNGKKTPGTTPNKIPHICKVRNTIFSKVPQIIPSKKYMNVQSPVAQNRLMESPHHLHHAHTSGSLKSSKKKNINSS